MGILGPKCEGCWERVENCTCGRYTKLDDFGPTVRYNGEPDEVVRMDDIRDLKNDLKELKKEFERLCEALRLKNDYKNY